MKTILLMRHGKSSWDYQVSDRDRPLLERGIRDAARVGKEFLKDRIIIDAAFSSPANRAMHTAIIFLRTISYPLDKFKLSPSLYDFSGDDVYSFIRSLDNTKNTVMLFGHNEAFTHIANSLGDVYISNVPTSGFVELKFDTNDWGAVIKGVTGRTIFPKHIRE